MRHAGATATVIKYSRDRFGQTDALIDLPKQQYATVTDNIAAIKCGFNHAPPNLPQLKRFFGTIWHRRSPVINGVRYQ